MNTPVSFSTAKLAIQKGFDKECKEYWNLVEYSSEWIVEHRINPDSVDFMYAPNIADVLMWLYEKHGVWISVYKYRDHAADNNDPFVFRSNLTVYKEFKTPQAAYEAAIDYALNHII